MHPTKTPADMLTTLTDERARRWSELVHVTGRMGQRFASIALALDAGAFADAERALEAACSDALCLPRLAAYIRGLDTSIALFGHIVK